MRIWRQREAKWGYGLFVVYGVLIVFELFGYLMGWAVPV